MWDLACLAKVFLQQEAFWVIPLRESRSPSGEGKALFTSLYSCSKLLSIWTLNPEFAKKKKKKKSIFGFFFLKD